MSVLSHSKAETQVSLASGVLNELEQGVGAPALPVCAQWEGEYKYNQSMVCATMPPEKVKFCQAKAVCAKREKVYKAKHLYAKGTIDHLIVLLPGTGTPPTLPAGERPTTRRVTAAAAQTGSYVITMAYASWPLPVSVCNLFCQRPNAPSNCLAKQHEQVLFGGKYAEGNMWTVDEKDSVTGQLREIIKHLGWTQFLDDSGEIDWRKVTGAGHSQGAVHIAYLAHEKPLFRAVLFSGPQSDLGDSEVPWIEDWHSKGATKNVYAMFQACEDTPGKIASQLELMGLSTFQDFGQRNALGPSSSISSDGANQNYVTAERPTDAECSNISVTSRAVRVWFDPMLASGRPEHESVFVDDKTPITLQDHACYMHLWRTLMDPALNVPADTPGAKRLSEVKNPAENAHCNLSSGVYPPDVPDARQLFKVDEPAKSALYFVQ